MLTWIALGLVLGVVAATPADQGVRACADPIVDPSGPVVTRVGDEFAIALEATPSTGFSWSVTVEPDPAVVASIGDEPIRAAPALPGAPGLQCFAFRGSGAGSTTMELAYARPFEPDVAPARTAKISVVVTSGGRVPVQLPGG